MTWLPRQHPIDHDAGKAEIVGGIDHLFQLMPREMARHLGILRQQIDERRAGRRHLAADVVDEIMRALAAEMRAEPGGAR